MKENVNEQINVDSLLLRLPLVPELVKLNPNSGINDEFILTNIITGEEKPFIPKEKIDPLTIDGIKFKFWKSILPVGGVANEFLYVVINSHMLKSSYFDGITLENIELIYNEIQSLNIALFSFDTFLNQSQCTDIDFKKDFKIDVGDYKILLKKLRESTKVSKLANGYKNYEGGLQWNTRRGATKTKPFIKLYDKTTQLHKKCGVFNNLFLRNVNIDNLKRIEFTVKNLKHLKRLGIVEPNNSLKSILNLTVVEKKNLQTKILSEVIDIENSFKISKLPETKLTGKDLVIFNSITHMMKTNHSFSISLTILAEGLNQKAKKRFLESWEPRKRMFVKSSDSSLMLENFISLKL